MVPDRRSPYLVEVLADLGMLALAALAFAFSFPSFLSDWGWFPLGFICLIPVFFVLHRARWAAVPFYGFFFGYISYAVFNYWLGTFHPLTLIIVPPLYAFFLLLAFPALKLADTLFPRHGYLLQAALWVCYEYFLKGRGFLAYSYGNLGYSQYQFLPFIRIADIFGVWGVTLLVVFPSTLLGNALKDGAAALRRGWRAYIAPAGIYAIVFAAVLVYGFAVQVDAKDTRPWRVALVQQNVDPWQGGFTAYRESLDALVRQSQDAMRHDPQIVIWSETSFVPAIDWHTRYRTDSQTYGLVKELREYLAAQPVPYLVGNDDGQLVRGEFGQNERVDYNATILFDKGEILDTYRKLHLVPFTESFPFEKQLPAIYKWLEESDTHFWRKGTQYTVFDARGVRFSTPICFEDTFGDLCRRFFRDGAQVLVNMTNDAWSVSVPCAMQHMGMAVFRAVENKRSVIRSTNAGMTCIIDPNGRILSLLQPFTEGYLFGEVPVYTGETTLYTRWGDWFPFLLLWMSAIAVFYGIVRAIVRRRTAMRGPEAGHATGD